MQKLKRRKWEDLEMHENTYFVRYEDFQNYKPMNQKQKPKLDLKYKDT